MSSTGLLGAFSSAIYGAKRPIAPTKTQNARRTTQNGLGEPRPSRVPASRDRFCLRAHLEDEEQRDDQRVDDERLDEREAENHRTADLASGARVTSDAVESSGSCTALTETATERRDGDAEASRESDHA